MSRFSLVTFPSLRRFDWSAALVGAPAVLLACLCCAVPLAWMAGALLLHPEVRSELALSSFRAELLGRTLSYNGLAALLATAMGIPAGLVLGRGRGRMASLLWLLLPAALLLPSLAYAYGWKQMTRLFLPPMRPNGAADVFRCIWSLAAWLWAVPAGLIGLTLRRMDVAVQQQAMLDGALWRVTLRQLAGPILASIAVVTILATQEFAVYEPTGISVIATEVRMVFDTGSLSSITNSIAGAVPQGEGLHSSNQAARAAAAVATAAPMLGVTVLFAVLAAWGASQTAASDSLSVGEWPPALDSPRWLSGLTFGLLFLNLGVPVISLFASIHRRPNPWRVYDVFAPQIGGTLTVGAVAAGVAAVIAFSAAGRWTRGLIVLAGATFLIGGQLVAIALIRIFNRSSLDVIYNSDALIVIAYVGRFGWLALTGGRSTWSAPWRELRQMASVDGAGSLRTALWIVWPLAWPTLLAGGLLVGAMSLTEVPATVLIMPQDPPVLTTMMMTWVHALRSDDMIEASLLMMFAVLIPAVGAVLLTKLGLRISRRGFQA